MYSVTDEGILLKKVDVPELDDHEEIIGELAEKSEKIKLKKSNLKKSIDNYKKTKAGNLDVI